MMKRGRYNRHFLHFATVGVLSIGIAIGPLLAETYPVFSSESSVAHVPSPGNNQQSITSDNNVFETKTSNKPRDTIVTYTVERGDTLSIIAVKFGLSPNTIKWQNNLTDDSITVGDQLKIPPVDGIVHKVESGETIYSIAKKYQANPQEIADWPFNQFANPETFSLVDGQMLIVPHGVAPADQTVIKQPTYIVQAPNHIAFSGGGFHWPVQGEITQGFSWYHLGIDIAGPVGTPVYAARAGIIADASGGWSWGYGNHVVINHSGGYSTMYAHLENYVVSNGESVDAGQLIGYRGNTGKSTGPHTHFEIRTPNGNVNPISLLQ